MNQLLSLTIIFGIISCISCNSNKTTSSDTELQTSVTVDTLNNSELDKKLKTQLNEYLHAFNGGDPDLAITYCYPDIFVYLKKEYPADYSDEAIKDVFRDPIKKMNKLAKEKNIKYDFKIGNISNRVTSGNNKFCTILASIETSIGLDKHTFGDEIICISNDNGDNWKFLEKDTEMAPAILKMKFSEDIVTQIMNK